MQKWDDEYHPEYLAYLRDLADTINAEVRSQCLLPVTNVMRRWHRACLGPIAKDPRTVGKIRTHSQKDLNVEVFVADSRTGIRNFGFPARIVPFAMDEYSNTVRSRTGRLDLEL